MCGKDTLHFGIASVSMLRAAANSHTIMALSAQSSRAFGILPSVVATRVATVNNNAISMKRVDYLCEMSSRLE